MGCDIHLWVEHREHAGAPWTLDPQPEFRCGWCSDGESPCYWCDGSGITSRFGDRNYSLFAMLADVRNGRGKGYRDRWSGPYDVEDDRIEPVSEPRGWPLNMSPELARIVESESDDDDEPPKSVPYGRRLATPGDHSAGWLTVDEIDQYLERSGTFCRRGFLALDDFPGFPANFYADGSRVAISKGVGGRGVAVLSQDEARSMLAGELPRAPHHFYYVEVEMVEQVRDAIGHTFVHEFLPACRKLAARASDVRLVFNFDS